MGAVVGGPDRQHMGILPQHQARLRAEALVALEAVAKYQARSERPTKKPPVETGGFSKEARSIT